LLVSILSLAFLSLKLVFLSIPEKKQKIFK
jgi:hypothetical protein